MSTPSMVTATNPLPHHLHYGYSPHHQGYPPPPHPYGGSSNARLLNRSPRLTNGHYSFTNGISGIGGSTTQPSTVLKPAPPRTEGSNAPTSSVLPPSRKRQRGPDWVEFYKNGLPKEVIVIDDDDGDDGGGPTVMPSSMTRGRVSTRHHPRSAVNPQTSQNDHQPASKRRKMALSRTTTYDPALQARRSSSVAQVYNRSVSAGAPTISTDRTTSAVHTTAPTSMGSNYSHAETAAHQPYGVSGPATAKRRRTRKQLADEAKKTERQGDAYSNYFPPPKPPIKSRDVQVSVVQDYSQTRNQRVDDEDGHYIVVPNSTLTDRYQVGRLLGQGTFGKVVEAYDKRKRAKCAIKIIRSVQKYRDASRIELRVLETLALNDTENRNKCIHLRDCFDFRNHICIVTDLLGQSVFDFLKSNDFAPFPNSHIQSFARQLFTSVAFLHDLNLVHTDLKPENVLLVDGTYQTFTYGRQIPSSTSTIARTVRNRKVLFDTEIRLIDFGSATFEDEYHSSVVSTRHYRAPEIILGLGWSFPCDIWSIGCILVEFFTGDALFQTHDNLEHLAMMENVCGGRIEPRLIRMIGQTGRGGGGNPASKYFTRGQRLNYPNRDTSKGSKRYVNAMKALSDIIPANTRFNKQFLDLLRRIFLYDPKARITAKEAMKHPWFSETTTDDGSEAARLRLERDLAPVGE